MLWRTSERERQSPVEVSVLGWWLKLPWLVMWVTNLCAHKAIKNGQIFWPEQQSCAIFSAYHNNRIMNSSCASDRVSKGCYIFGCYITVSEHKQNKTTHKYWDVFLWTTSSSVHHSRRLSLARHLTRSVEECPSLIFGINYEITEDLGRLCLLVHALSYGKYIPPATLLYSNGCSTVIKAMGGAFKKLEYLREAHTKQTLSALRHHAYGDVHCITRQQPNSCSTPWRVFKKIWDPEVTPIRALLSELAECCR